MVKTFISPEPRKVWGGILVYSIGIRDSMSTKVFQMMILGYLSFSRYGQICVLVTVAKLEVLHGICRYAVTVLLNVSESLPMGLLFLCLSNILYNFLPFC